MKITKELFKLQDNDYAAFPVLDYEVEDTHVLCLHSGGGIYHEDADVGMLYGPYGAHYGIELKVFVDFGLSSDTGCVYEHEFVSELVVMGLNGVSGGTCYRSDYVAVFTKKCIGEG